MQHVVIQVIGMSCGYCVKSVENALNNIGARGRVNLKEGSVNVTYDEIRLKLETITNAIEDLGYDIDTGFDS
nr:cation transporter [Paenibacillus harenae]